MTVLAAVPDLFFASRLQDLARRSGVSLLTVGDARGFADALAQAQPTLVLVDLSARGLDPSKIIREAKMANVPEIIAFGPHKDLTARAIALAAGATQWVTNQRLVEVLTEIFAKGDAEGR